MTFLLDLNRRQRVANIVDNRSTVNKLPGSFMDFLKIERTKIVCSGVATKVLSDALVVLKATYKDLDENDVNYTTIRNDMKREWNRLSDAINNESDITVDVFERNIRPFLDLYQKRVEQNITDDDLIDSYKREFYPRESSPVLVSINMDLCPICNTDMTFNTDDAMLCCMQCGTSARFIDASAATIAYGDEVEYTSFSYKRINHLNEYLNHFQAKEATPVPNDVVYQIIENLYEKRIRNVDAITFAHVKKAQKDIGQRKYYDQTMQLWCRITGKPPLRLDPVMEEKIRLLFMQIQEPFTKFCPPSRKNFLSYPYCMYKFCQLLNYNHLLCYLSLLKGKDKLKIQEEIFEKICLELDWSFIPL